MLLIYFIFGACLASFLTCCADRLRRGESLWTRSHCDHCQHPLSPLWLIPIFGYLFQGGRCHTCKASIPWRYPILETALGLYIAAVAWCFQGTEMIAMLLPVPFLFTIGYEDAQSRWIDDRLQCGFAVTVGITAWMMPEPPLSLRLLGAALYGGILWLLAQWRPDGLGMADVIFVAIAGFDQGVTLFSKTFLAAVLVALCHGLWQVYRDRTNWRHKALPLLPYMTVSYLLTPLLFA